MGLNGTRRMRRKGHKKKGRRGSVTQAQPLCKVSFCSIRVCQSDPISSSPLTSALNLVCIILAFTFQNQNNKKKGLKKKPHTFLYEMRPKESGLSAVIFSRPVRLN